MSPIRVFIDPDSGLPAKADTREDDPYYGDTLFEAIFADWRQVGEIMMPFGLTHSPPGDHLPYGNPVRHPEQPGPSGECLYHPGGTADGL